MALSLATGSSVANCCQRWLAAHWKEFHGMLGHDLVTGNARSGEPPTASMSRTSALRQLSTKFRGEAKHPHKEQNSKANAYRKP